MGKKESQICTNTQWPLIKVTNCEFLGVSFLVTGQWEGAPQKTDIIVNLEEK